MTDFRQLYIDYISSPPGYLKEDRHGRPTKQHKSRVRNPQQYANVKETPINEQIDLYSLDDQKQKVWVWSDQHFGHKNIIKYSNRPFADTDDMRESMIRNHNELVGIDDVVIWIGDVAFLPDDKANEILHRLNGYKILIIGNHDMNKKKLKKLHVDEVHMTYDIDCGGLVLLFTHFPLGNLPTRTDEGATIINVHGHTHDKQDQSVQHINCSVERIEYKPVGLINVIVEAQSRALELLG